MFYPVRHLDSASQVTTFFRELGYELPGNQLFGAVPALVQTAEDLIAAVEALASASDDAARLQALANLLDALATMVGAIHTAINDIKASVAAIPGFLANSDIDELPVRLVDYLLSLYLSRSQRRVYGVLLFIGVLDEIDLPAAAAKFQPAFKLRKIWWDRLPKFVSQPKNLPELVYKWETAFDSALFLSRLYILFNAFNLPGGLYTQSETVKSALQNTTDGLQELRMPIFEKAVWPSTHSQFGINVSPVEQHGADKPGFAIIPFVAGETSFDFDVSERFEILFTASASIDAGIGLVFRPDSVRFLTNLFTTPAESGDAGLLLEVNQKEASDEILLLGSASGSRLAVQGVHGKVFVDNGGEIDAGFELKLDALRLVVTGGDGDGFISKILGDRVISAEATLGIGLSRKGGLFFTGSGGLEIQLPVHIQLGPLEIQGLVIALKVSDENLLLETGANLKVELGPLIGVVENIGISARLAFPDGGGNLGPMDLSVGFKPPKGVGLSLDAGGFKGGGFLRLDSEKGEYAGALELDFNGLFSVKAIGIINTKMPDGSKGFSLLIVIAAEFTPIQLSFGFTLNGVGGIFGLNRKIVVPALAEGIRTNAVKSILFPENVIANISRIISDIKQFFPPQQDHFVVGPMAKLGWGTPSIITVELGLLLDLPDPMFAIVGVLKAVLPAEEAPVLRLQVNFLGVVDFNRGYIFFRADLFDSRLLIYSITGTMAFLVSWGEAQTFALSVGGFHPDFRDLPTIPALPDGFRSMARIGISLLSDDNPRLKVESYFAVTANTVQFGARVELYAEAAGFNIYGFLGYDVLFQFDPFRFLAKLSGGIALRRRSSVIASVNISATLSGPTPWDARGKASLSLLFFTISVGFHVTWGDPPPAITSATEDLLQLLKREFADTRNWRADLPPNNHLHVSLRKIELPAATEMLVIHPAGVLTFSQRSLPLEDFAIAKFGNKKPLAENKFKITNANSEGAEIPADYQGVREQFAPGNFLELSDSEKLSRKSFDSLPSGFKLPATANLLTTLPVVRDVEYELSYLRRERIVPKGLIKLFVLAYDRLVKGSAVRQSGLSQQQTRRSLNAPPQVGLPQESFAVANAADLKSHATTASGPVLFSTQAEAYQHQQDLIAQNPALAGQIQVVSHFELNPN